MPSFGGNPGNRALPLPPAPRSAGAPPSHTDVTSGGGYGGQQATAFKQTPAYKQAVVSVFKAQPPAQQHAIIQGARQNPTPEGRMILAHIGGQDPFSQTINRLGSQGAIKGSVFGAGSRAGIKTDPNQKPPGGGGLLDTVGDALGGAVGGLGDAAKFVYNLSNPSRLTQPGLSQGTTPAQRLVEQGAGAIGKGLQALPLSNKGPGGVQTAGVTQGQFVKNLGKDVVNMAAEALPSIAIPVGEALTGHPGRALSTIVQPYEQIAKDPIGMGLVHPGLTALAVGAPLHGATRGLAAPVRALAPDSALGKAVSTQREGVALTGNLTHERVPYSPSPTLKSSQVSVERSLYKRAADGRLVPRNEFVRDKLIRQGVAEVVSARERIRRANRGEVQIQRNKAVNPSIPAKIGHGVKTAASYNPPRAAIPGAGVLARIADLTVRTKGTFVADLQKHLQQVAATRPELVKDFPELVKEHDAYVKTIQQAIDHPATGKALDKLFAAAEQYRKDYAPVQAGAHHLGYFGDMTAEALQRRDLMHYAQTHIPGVEHDALAGLVRPGTKVEVRAEVSRLRAQARTLEAKIDSGRGGTATQADLSQLRARIASTWDKQKVPLPTQEILDHLKGPEGTGGRLPAFTSDKPSSSSAFYVSGERRPLPATARNTLFAYTHGLTDPTHEALLNQHAQMQGVIDAHHSQNEYLNTLAEQKSTGGYWPSHAAAKADAPKGYVPINVSHPFHPASSLDQAMQDVHPALLADETARRGLDLTERLRPDSPGGKWAVIDEMALKALKEQQAIISPGTVNRVMRGLNTQFRQVALGTSPKHIPGVAFENMIRDISYGVGFRSWVTGHRIAAKWEKSGPAGKDMRARMTGGQLAGATDFGRTYSTAEHYRGTNVYPFLKGFEATMKAPGPRQLRTAWKAWSHLVIQGTKHVLEEQHQIAAIGKQALKEHGYVEAAKTQGFLGAVQRLLGLHGQMLDDAAKGLFDPAKARQYRAGVNRMYGTWTDLTPTGKVALMYSPFGLWWVNSVRFLARMPLDQPVKTGLLASANMGTEKQRQALGLDLFSPNALPGYMQGGIPSGNQIIAQNYYSPFGVANDPLATGSSLIEPWLQTFVTAPLGVNWLGKPLTSPSNPRGTKPANTGEKAQYLIDSVLSSFLPLYTKAKQLAEGGASPYDVSGSSPVPPLLEGKTPPTKKPGNGISAGLSTALKPYRSYKRPAPGGGGGSNWLNEFSGGGSGGYQVPGSGGGGDWIKQFGG